MALSLNYVGTRTTFLLYFMCITVTSESSYCWHLQTLLFHFKCWPVVSWFPEQLGPSSTFCEGGSAWIVLWTVGWLAWVRLCCSPYNLSRGIKLTLHSDMWREHWFFFKFIATDLYFFLHPTQSFSQPRGKTYLHLARFWHYSVGPFKVSFELLGFGVLVPFLSIKLGFA